MRGDTVNSKSPYKNFYVTSNLGLGGNLSILSQQRIALDFDQNYSNVKKSFFGYGKAGLLVDYHYNFIPVDRTKTGYTIGIRVGADFISYKLNKSTDFLNNKAYFAIYHRILMRKRK